MPVGRTSARGSTRFWGGGCRHDRGLVAFVKAHIKHASTHKAHTKHASTHQARMQAHAKHNHSCKHLLVISYSVAFPIHSHAQIALSTRIADELVGKLIADLEFNGSYLELWGFSPPWTDVWTDGRWFWSLQRFDRYGCLNRDVTHTHTCKHNVSSPNGGSLWKGS